MSVARANNNSGPAPLPADDGPTPPTTTATPPTTTPTPPKGSAPAKDGFDSRGPGPWADGGDGLAPAPQGPLLPSAPAGPAAAASTDTAPIPVRSPKVERALDEIKKKSPEDYKKIYAALQDLGSLEPHKMLKALGTLEKQFGQNLKAVLEHFGMQDAKAFKLVNNPDAMKALGTLFDPKSDKLELAQAALELCKEASDVFELGELKGAFGPIFKSLPVGPKVLELIITFSDDKKSGLEKAKAGLELVGALRDFAGELTPGLKRAVSNLAGSFTALESIFTIFDDKASLSDRGAAVLKLLAEVPDLKQDLTRFKQLLEGAGIKDAALLVEVAEKGGGIKQVALKGLSSTVAQQLSPAELAQVQALATKLGSADDLGTVLGKLDNPDAVRGLLGQLDKLDAAAGKRLLKLCKEMEMGGLAGVLKHAGSAESLGKLASKLDEVGVDTAKKMLKGLSADACKVLFKLTDAASPTVLKQIMKGMGPVLDKIGSDVLGKSLELLDKMLGKMGVAITTETAEKVFKTLLKVLPAVGAIPGFIDAGKYTMEAVNLQGKSKDLAMLATVGAGLNTADSVIGLILDATGVGIAADVGIGVVFGIAELALDLGFEAEKKKLEANPKGYVAPDWVKATNLAFAAAAGPGGPTLLLANYGVQGTVELLAWAAQKGMKVAGPLLAELGKAGAQGLEALEGLAKRGVTAAGDFLAATGRTVRDATDGEVVIAGRKIDVNPLW